MSTFDCEAALSETIFAIADEALSKGWAREEITSTIMELANHWHFRGAGTSAEKPPNR